MNKFKKQLVVFLAFVMILGAFMPSAIFAEENKTEEKVTKVEETKKEKVEVSAENKEKVDYLVKNEIVSGRTVDGAENDLALDQKINRAEVTKLLVYAMKKESLADAVKDSEGKFSDVKTTHWANGFINVASSGTHKIIKGYPDNTFGPDRDVTYAEMAAMLARVIDPKIDDTKIEWPSTYTKYAEKHGLMEGLKVTDWNDPAEREAVFVMLYNSLKVIEKNDEEAGKPTKNQYLGIVSNIVGNRIELNQDSKLRFDVNFETVYVNGVNPTVGALVRIALDGKGNITHVVVLGTPKDGAIEKGKNWAGIAEKTVQTNDFKSNTKDFAVIGKDTVTVNGIKGIVGVNTKIFVGEKALREVRDIKAAIGDKDKVSRVYMGYNKIGETKLAEASVIVFNADTVALPGETSVVRVVEPINHMLKIEVEDIAGKKTTQDLTKAGSSPFTKEGLDKNDIIELVVDKDTKKVNGYNTLLDSKEAPIVTVEKIDKNKVTLKDSKGELDFFLLDKKNVFGTLSVGANVQIVMNKKYGEANLIDYVSVLDKDVKPSGSFDIEGREFSKVHGTLVVFNKVNSFDTAVTMYVNVKDNVKQYTVMNSDDIYTLTGLKPGTMIAFTALDVEGTKGTLAYGIEISTEKSELGKQLVKDIEELKKMPLVTKTDALAAKAKADKIDAILNAQPGLENQVGPQLIGEFNNILDKIDSILNPVPIKFKEFEGIKKEYVVEFGKTFAQSGIPATVNMLLTNGTKHEHLPIYWDMTTWKGNEDFADNGSNEFTLQGVVNLPPEVESQTAQEGITVKVKVLKAYKAVDLSLVIASTDSKTATSIGQEIKKYIEGLGAKTNIVPVTGGTPFGELEINWQNPDYDALGQEVKDNKNATHEGIITVPEEYRTFTNDTLQVVLGIKGK